MTGGRESFSGAAAIQRHTGEWPVYPGHPLVLALAIMEVFDGFDEANAPTGHGWCAALGDSRIPGAGCHVGAAIRTLKLGAEGKDVEAMVCFATDYWESGQAGGHHKNVAAGRDQALKAIPRFRELAAVWFNKA